MTVVIGTAGHIDHGKTSLLRALTGIDADRLPAERERGLTIDVGYAHVDLDDGTSLDFVDVPGHDRYVGNMLVGAGEIDAALLVVAADDGPRPQTIEHLQLLDALEIRDGLAVVTKVDAVAADRVAEVAGEVERLLAMTTLAGSPVIAASSATGEGIEAVASALRSLRDRVALGSSERPAGPLRLAIDRVFAIRGRGTVVTGSLRGGAVTTHDRLTLEPGGTVIRVRGLQVHNVAVPGHESGRTAVNVAGAERGEFRRGTVLTRGVGIEATDRLLVAARPVPDLGERDRASWPIPPGELLRLHVGTDQVDAVVRPVRRGDRPGTEAETAVVELRLSASIATFVGDRAVLRRSSPGRPVAAVRVLDSRPPRGASRRRVTSGRIADLVAAIEEADVDRAADALVALHGAIPSERIASLVAALRRPSSSSVSPVDAPAQPGLVLAPDVVAALEASLLATVAGAPGDGVGVAGAAGVEVADLRAIGARALRRLVAVDRAETGAANDAVDRPIADLVARRRVLRDGTRIRDVRQSDALPAALTAAMARLEAALAIPAPPALSEAARAAGCSADGIRALQQSGRIVRIERDLAWATPTYHELARVALDLASGSPLTPAAFRDATGTSRRYVLAILEDLDRREILRRTPDGHVPGPRAPRGQPAPPGSALPTPAGSATR